MHANDQVSELPVSQTHLDFQTSPERYRHWQLSFDGPIAELKMDVDENAGMFPGYELKLNFTTSALISSYTMLYNVFDLNIRK